GVREAVAHQPELVVELYFTPEAEVRHAALAAAARDAGIDVELASEAAIAAMADTRTPQGVVAVARQAPVRLRDAVPAGARLVVVLDGVQDPGNVGTLLRTAAAFGVAVTLAMPETVDLWNAKVVRSAMGALFRHQVLACDWDAFDALRTTQRLQCWAADASGEPVDQVRGERAMALVVGNEGAGLSNQTRARADRRVAIPISADVESLNVAVAAGILLYQFRP
ncbi:MAG TPA: RNA methyltransferase, partial [Gemmatimonadaceae bacterium]|nr:RNA methyltransferase [Gemmatimonadaceae bacterium]